MANTLSTQEFIPDPNAISFGFSCSTNCGNNGDAIGIAVTSGGDGATYEVSKGEKFKMVLQYVDRD